MKHTVRATYVMMKINDAINVYNIDIDIEREEQLITHSSIHT